MLRHGASFLLNKILHGLFAVFDMILITFLTILQNFCKFCVMSERCVFLRCVCNGKISVLGFDFRAGLLELARILQRNECAFVQSAVDLGTRLQRFSKQYFTPIKEGST